MLLLGILLVLIGLGLGAAGLFTADLTASGDLEVVGIGVAPGTLFLLGLIAAVALVVGLWVSKAGAKREWRQRREEKEIDELSDKLDRAEANRRRDLDDSDE